MTLVAMAEFGAGTFSFLCLLLSEFKKDLKHRVSGLETNSTKF